MRKTILLVMAAMLSVYLWGCRHTEVVTVAPKEPVTVDGIVMEDGIVTVDGIVHKLKLKKPEVDGPARPEGTGLMWEWENGAWKACICQMVGFRALEAFGQYIGINDIPSAYIDISTGWNTDGPDTLFQELMNWEGEFSYADPITENDSLTLADAWYDFTVFGLTYRVRSAASNYDFAHDKKHSGYREGWDFIDYRTAVKTGKGTIEEKTYFKEVVRPQIVANFQSKETVFQIKAMLHRR